MHDFRFSLDIIGLRVGSYSEQHQVPAAGVNIVETLPIRKCYRDTAFHISVASHFARILLANVTIIIYVNV
jgi:hypothetical protein